MKPGYLGFFTAIFCASAVALAQTATDNPDATPKTKDAKKPVEVQKVSEEVVVSATREARSAADLPVSVTVVSGGDVKVTPAHTVDDILRTIPGVNLPASSSLTNIPNSDAFSMRGLGGVRALVLLDGAPVNDPWSGDLNWSRISRPTIDRIEVARGGAASLYGNYAMTGMVGIFSQKADAPRLWADAAYGSYNTSRVDAMAEQPISDSVGLGVNIDTFSSDGYHRVPADQAGKINIPFWSSNKVAGFRLDKISEGDLDLSARGSFFDTHISQGSPDAHDRKQGYEGSANANWKDAFGGDLSGTFYAIHQVFDTDNSSLVPGQGNNAEFPANAHVLPSQALGTTIQWTRSLGAKVPFVMVGVDGERILGEDHFETFNSSGATTGMDRLGGRQDFGGVFVQADYYPAPSLEILASGRLDLWRNFNGHDYSATGPDILQPSKSTARLDPRLSIRDDLGSGWAVRLSGYRAFGAPTLDALYEKTTTKTNTTIPNPDLGPESLLGAEAGIDYVGGPVSLQVNVFENRATDLITRVTVATKPSVISQRVNIGATRSTGVELIGEAILGPRFHATAGYTFTNPIIVDNPPNRALEGNQIPQVAKNFGSGSLTYEHPAGWTATLRGRYYSRTFQDSSNLVPLSPAAIFDAFVAIPLGSSFDLTLTGENLLDHRFVSDASQGARIGEPAMYFVGIRLHPFSGSASRAKRSAS